MKAMILAAGLGTRLRPLTDDRPKALVEVAGRTLLEIALCRLRSFGVDEVIVNVHHFSGMIVDSLKAHNNFGLKVKVSLEEDLLDTGGGLKKAAWFFNGNSQEPFILHNVDVLSSIDLVGMVRFHRESNALATLAVQRRASSRLLLFDDQGRLCGRRSESAEDAIDPRSENPDLGHPHSIDPRSQNRDLGHPKSSSPQNRDLGHPHSVDPRSQNRDLGHPNLTALAFSGIHILSPHIFAKLEEEGSFSIISAYLRLAAQGEKIIAFRADGSYWRDLGRPESIRKADEDFDCGRYSVVC